MNLKYFIALKKMIMVRKLRERLRDAGNIAAYGDDG